MKATKVHIRIAKEKDIATLTRIYNSIITEGGYTADLTTYSIEERESWFKQHSAYPYNVFVIELDQKIQGYFYFSPWRAGREALKGVAEISFFLAKEARGKGMGDLIMERSIIIAKEYGFKHLLAILMDLNTRSAVLLKKWGFRVVGELPDVIDLPDMVAGQLIMLKKL